MTHGSATESSLMPMAVPESVPDADGLMFKDSQFMPIPSSVHMGGLVFLASQVLHIHMKDTAVLNFRAWET